MEQDTPLPLKLTVNPTPHGIMIMIPRLWSLDVKRDIDWNLVQKLHHCYGAKRQGPRLSPARVDIHEEEKAVVRYWVEAQKIGLRGDRKYSYVLSKMKKHPRTDPSWLKRRLKKARQYGLYSPHEQYGNPK